MNKYVSIMIFATFLFVSCSDNSVDTYNDNSFTIDIKLTNSNGSSLSNVNVSVWSKINYSNIFNKKNENKKINASSTIRFDIPQQCFASMIIYNLNGKIVDKIISKTLMPGVYASTWSTLNTNGVYKCKLSASSDTLGNDILFKDSIYVVINSPDPSVSLIGKTDGNGNIKISNKLLFPHLFNLPLIPHTSADSPQVLGYINFPDTVIIALSDATFSKTRLFDREIKNGLNNISLNVGDSLFNYATQKNNFEDKINQYKLVQDSVVLPSKWTLYQNYPNPFN